MQPLGAEATGRSFDLVLSDEFRGGEKDFKVNSNRWNNLLQEHRPRAGINIPMYYQDNNWIENDNLVQQWRYDEDTDIYSSGKIDSKGIYSPVFGWYEVRMEIVDVNGSQSAFWLWPENGKLDYYRLNHSFFHRQLDKVALLSTLI